MPLYGSQAAQIKFQAHHKGLAFSLHRVISSGKLFPACVRLGASKTHDIKCVIHFVITEERKKKRRQVSELSVKGRQQDLAGITFVTDTVSSAMSLLFFVLIQGRGHLKYENRNLHCLLKAAYLCACLWLSLLSLAALSSLQTFFCIF